MNIVFATNNAHKIQEIQLLLNSDNIKVLSLKDITCSEELPENQTTLEGNAIEKAQYVFENYGYSCFADDTGLEIPVLNNSPGVYSARYAGPQRDANDNMQKILTEMQGKSNRHACFRTVICLILNGEKHLFEGRVDGEILQEPIGTAGFGYDPIFAPNTEGPLQSFAQMNIAEKNTISHRGRAVRKLIQFLTTV
jgi:XTP/dITP diphosphohydrolase